MKKIFTFIAAMIFLNISGFSQIFYEDFSDGIPSTFTIIDKDQLTPNSAFGGFFTESYFSSWKILRT